MSFFGFDTSLPRDRPHQQSAPGFSANRDEFEALAGRGDHNDDILDFEDTYEGFGTQIDDTADDLNNDTFGTSNEPATQNAVGRDFDFSGQTGNVAQAFEEERMRWAAQHAPSRVSQPNRVTKPKRTGYEYIPQLEADADLWGIAPKKDPELPRAQPTSARKAMTLEEVEAMMLAQSQQNAVNQALHPAAELLHSSYAASTPHQEPHPPLPLAPQEMPSVPHILQRPHPQQQPVPVPHHGVPGQGPVFDGHSMSPARPTQILQRQRPAPDFDATSKGPAIPTGPKGHQPRQPSGPANVQPRHILQNPNRLSGQGQPIAHGNRSSTHNRGSSYNGPIITTPQQILHLSDEDRAAYLQEEARRAKRNHKIHLLSKFNGIMTPQDKSFITRIQLQQLVTATGSVDADSPEAVLNEDFYYQVYSQIRGAPRQNPHQPANQFAQTYLFQTGRPGRRQHRGGDNHMQRMEQQVQRAIESARAKPKNKQLVIEGSLGKISFSNAKTPKPLLNIKRLDSEPLATKKAVKHGGAESRRETLRNIENMYSVLMEMEDHARLMPLEESHMFDMWASRSKQLNDKLWLALKAHEPVVENHTTLHPFVAILSHSKGKKAIPRVFRHLTSEQRTIVMTITVVHLDTLDVVHKALVQPIPPLVKEEVELFASTVLPAFLSHLNEEPLMVNTGLLGLIISRCDVGAIVRTKTGLSMLTILISRAEVLKEGLPQNAQHEPQSAEWDQYTTVYNSFFNALEPMLPHIFLDSNPMSSDDVYVWQFLAAMGAAASAEQQQRLVLGVKDRVMTAVGAARTLPHGEQERRLGEVNLFMRALGLDVELLA